MKMRGFFKNFVCYLYLCQSGTAILHTLSQTLQKL